MANVKRYYKSFLLLIAVPLITFFVTSVCLKAYHFVTLKATIGISSIGSYVHGSELELYMKGYARLLEKYKVEMTEEPSKILELVEAKDINQRMSKYGFYLVILDDRHQVISDTTGVDQSILGNVLECAGNFNEGITSPCDDHSVFIHGDCVRYEGKEYLLCIIMATDKTNQTAIRERLFDGIVAGIVALVACVICMNWVMKNLLTPLGMLKDATEQIKQGNLNATLEYDDDGDIGELCRNFEDMRQKLRDNAEEAILSDKEMREMISNISHDLKTPLTAIKGYVEGLLDNVFADNPEKKKKYLQTIYNKATDMDKLIDELTLYSKIGSNRATYNFRKINVKEYFEDCTSALKIELDAKGIAFEYSQNIDDDVCIVADAEYLKRVINNIISNSVKNVSETDGRISIGLADEGQYIRVDMSDNGKGISTKDLPHIFDRFYRGDASRNTAQGGSGIGLSIVKKVIEEHSGKIWVTSKLGEGTTMSFLLKKSK